MTIVSNNDSASHAMNVRGAPAIIRFLGLLTFCLEALTACGSIPSSTGLDPAIPRSSIVARNAWIGPVRILDPAVQNRTSVEDSLTADIAKFVRESRGFLEVDSVPGKPHGDDVFLNFRFDRYRQERKLNPAYLPAAVLTLTLYTWLGGPVYDDASELSGMLTVKDLSGKTLAEACAHLTEQQSVSLWSVGYASFDGRKPRTLLVQELVDEAAESLRGTRPAQPIVSCSGMTVRPTLKDPAT
jgi:hypothetical protein